MNALLPYRAMAYNNGWANARLLGSCGSLTQAAFEAPRTGFFPSLLATLNHILAVDLFYLDAMEEGRPAPAAWVDREPCRTVAALQPAQAEADRRLIAFVEGLTADGLERVVAIDRDTHVQRERLHRLLLHVFQHQIHHRGQAHAMLSGTAVPPPQLDEFFSAGEAELREPEFERLGWTEERIWGR